jgi:hypothetical protein
MVAVVSIDAALRDARLFRGGRALVETRDGLPTGIAALDAALPWGGFPRGALSELLHASDGIGELSLLLPALQRLLANERVALIAPPYLPYPPALRQADLPLSQLIWIAPPAERALWSAEQCLRAGCLGGVLLWSTTGDDRALRRLQLAAEAGGSHAWLFRPLKQAANASPAALRLQVERDRLRVLKCRGAVLSGEFSRRAVDRPRGKLAPGGDPVPSPPAPLPGGEGSKAAAVVISLHAQQSPPPPAQQSPSPPGRGVGERVRAEPAATDLAQTQAPLPAQQSPSPLGRGVGERVRAEPQPTIAPLGSAPPTAEPTAAAIPAAAPPSLPALPSTSTSPRRRASTHRHANGDLFADLPDTPADTPCTPPRRSTTP